LVLVVLVAQVKLLAKQVRRQDLILFIQLVAAAAVTFQIV
jgi:hypothetical protein